MSLSDYDYMVKIIVVGDVYVGKTSICNKLSNNNKSTVTNYEPTIGLDFHLAHRTIKGKKWKIHLWDSSGHQSLKPLLKEYYKTCCICLLVGDASKKQTFTQLQQWVEDIIKFNPKMHFVFIKNKMDLHQPIYDNDNDNDEKYYKTSITPERCTGFDGLLEDILNKFTKEPNFKDSISLADGKTNIKGFYLQPKPKKTEELQNDIEICIAKLGCTVRTNKHKKNWIEGICNIL